MDKPFIFNDEQLRGAASLRQFYDAWIAAKCGDQVVCGRDDGTAARVVAPDPRW